MPWGNKQPDLKNDPTYLEPRVTAVESSLASIVSCRQYGFVADYTGTPQYDGNDGTRITCTDNTLAFQKMLDDCIAKKNLRVYFPAGHYGIKIGNVQRDLTGCNLSIFGDGMDLTIIDYVKEDATHNTTVDETTANYIARLTNPNNVELKDLTLKATTNLNIINPTTSSDIDYNGAVWGMIIENFNLLRCQNVKTERFNFKGISTNCTLANNTYYNNLNKKVELINCKGFYNRSSGFWIRQVQTLIIQGGEFAYNGKLGYYQTGYGVTASNYVKDIIVEGAYFHHNYRKGFDTHTLANVTIEGCVFEDNVHYDIAILGRVKISDINSYSININSTFRHGDTDEGKAWLQSAYQTVANNNTTSNPVPVRYWSIDIEDYSGTYYIKEINLTTNLQSAYNGSDVLGDISQYNSAFTLQAPNGTVRILNSNINLKDWTPNSTQALNAVPFNIACTKFRIINSEITWLEDSTFNTNQLGSLFFGSITNMDIAFRNTIFNLNNCFIFCTISGNVISDPGDSSNTLRTFENLTLRWIKLPSNSDNRKLLGSQTLYTRNWKNVSAYVNGFYFDVKAGILYDTKFIPAVYNGYNATDFISIVIDNQPAHYTFEFWGYNSDYIKIKDGAVVTDGTNITLSSATNFTDTDGRNKLKIKLKTKVYVASSGFDFAEVKLRGGGTPTITSWGIESITVL